MKKNKILLFAICLLCFFGFKLNTKALTVNLNLDYDFTNLSNIVSNNKTVIDDIISYIDENNYRDFEYTLTIRYNSPNFYLDVGITSLTADYIFYMPYINQYGLYDDGWSLGFTDGSSTHPSNFHQIVNGLNFTNYTSLNLSSYDSTNIVNLKNNIYSFLHTSSNASNGLKPQVAITSSYSLDYFSNSKYVSIYKSSLPVKFHNYYARPYRDIDLVINDDVYYYNDTIPTYFDYISNLTPILTVSNLTPIKDNHNNIIKYYVDVSFSSYDTINYKYEYCLDNVCQDFLDNNVRLELYQNGSYVFQILDNNDELIDSYSLTISNINIETPFIDYTLSVPYSCVAYIDNVSRNTCKSLKMEWGTSNPNYIYQYSVNNLDFENIYGSYSLLLVQNDIVVMRVIDNDNDVLWSKTITVNDLYTIDSSLGIFTTFNQTNFGKNESVSNYLEVYIYNLDLSYIDNVYISYDGFNFIKLDVYNRSTFFYGLSKALYSSQQIYINIKDNNDQIIYSTSYYVDMSKVANKGLLSYLENFNLSMNGPISNFVTTPLRFFQNIMNSSSVCSPLVLPTRIGNMSLPCMKTVYSSISIDLYNIIETIFSGILVYYCGLSIIKTLKSLVSLSDDRIEVVDL